MSRNKLTRLSDGSIWRMLFRISGVNYVKLREEGLEKSAPGRESILLLASSPNKVTEVMKYSPRSDSFYLDLNACTLYYNTLSWH